MYKTSIHRSLFITVFITGAAVLIIEVAAVRILSPIFGSSLYVLSSVLTIILAALSIGYWFGGKWADRNPSIQILYSIIAGGGLCVLVLLLLAQLLLPSIGTISSPMAGPLFFSLGLFFIPTFLLGIVSPYVIKIQSLTTPTEHIGSVVGATFFWGTGGSIVGSLATGFLLIPGLGVYRTIMLVGVALIALGVLMPLNTNQPLPKKIVATLLLSALILGGLLIIIGLKQQNKYIFYDDGIYSTIKIEDKLFDGEPVRFLLRDANSSSAVYFDSKKLVFPYTKFVLLYNKLVSNPREVLVLGGGAYTIPRTLTDQEPKPSH